MIINGQQAQIRVENNSRTVLYSGSTYTPKNVMFLGGAIDVVTGILPGEKYINVIISGSLDTCKGELTVTDLQLCQH